MALFKTSKKAREIMEKFRSKTTIRPNLWARAALGYSLSLEAETEKIGYDSEGTEFQENVFWGEYEDILLALLRQRLRRVPDNNEIGQLVKAHVERGLRLFYDEFQRRNQHGDELLLYLNEECVQTVKTYTSSITELIPKEPKTNTFEIQIEVGTDHKKNDKVVHKLNAPGTTPHLVIMGRNGTGKTRSGISIITHIVENSSYAIPFLIFDYAKGDIANNSEFVSKINAVVVNLPQEQIPLAPLALPVRDQHSVPLAARRFRDTICSVVNLGPVQKDRCLKLITKLYDDFDERTPNLIDLYNLAEQEYQENGYKPDSLLACLTEFSAFPLFRPAEQGADHDLFRKNHIIDIHDLPEDLRKLASFLVLDRLYSEIMRLPDAPLDKDNNRQIRLIIVIDEAHHYLPCRQPTLTNMVREVRSKGVGIWLFSQSPDDFDQKEFNFAKEMGLSIIFSCMVEKPKMLEALLGGKVDSMRMGKLPAGIALTRVHGNEFPIEVRLWQ